MKIRVCNNCGVDVQATTKFCPNCGEQGFTYLDENGNIVNDDQPVQTNAAPQPSLEKMINSGIYNGAEIDPVGKHGNVLGGILGAILFSLISVAIYVGAYQLGVLVGICGIVMFALAKYGYERFSGLKKAGKTSSVSTVTALLVTVAMILVAEVLSVALSGYIALQTDPTTSQYGFTFMDVLSWIPEMMAEDAEVAGAIAGDLAFAYLTAAVGIVVGVISDNKEKKKAKAKAAAAQNPPTIETESK